MSRPTRPVVVGLVRGVIEAVVLAALGAVAVAVTSLDLGPWSALAPSLIAVVRTVEGWLDDRIDPSTQRGPLGGRPA